MENSQNSIHHLRTTKRSLLADKNTISNVETLNASGTIFETEWSIRLETKSRRILPLT